MTEVLNMTSENTNHEDAGDNYRYELVAGKLKELAADIDAMLPEEQIAGLRLADTVDEFGNTLTIAKTSPSTHQPLGFAYLVQRQHKPRPDGGKGQLLRYSWHPVMMDSRRDQHYLRTDSESEGSWIEDRGFDLHDMLIIEGIIKYFKIRSRQNE